MPHNSMLHNRSVAIAICCFSACASAPAPGPHSTAPVDEIAAWEAFCDELKAVGVATLQDHAQKHEIDRAEGVRYLAQQIGAAVEAELLERERAFPLLRVGATTIDKWGLDGADAKYLGAPVDGSASYRLSGTLGDATLIALQLSRLLPTYEAFESLSGNDLGADSEGRFEVLISNERPTDWQGPWLRLDPRATSLLVREYFGDWADSTPSSLQIERLGEFDRDAPLTAADIEPMLSNIAKGFRDRVPMWLPRSKQTRFFLENKARPWVQDGEQGQGLSDNVYGVGWFSVEDNTAVVIEFEEPEALLWSIQLGNYWWESIDYVNGTGSLNGSQTFTNSDGKIRIVVALEDPGVPNWLDPAGHPEGMFLYRFQQATKSSDPEVRVVKLNELRGELPADTPTVNAEQRAAEVAMRRAHAARRWTP